MTATRQTLPDGRLHWQHGPIDLVIALEGEAAAVAAAQEEAWARFEGLLAELVPELPQLRRSVGLMPRRLASPVAQRMERACVPVAPFANGFLTPMAAVAGAVADELIAYGRRPGMRRAVINNGGDIALHLAAGQSLRVGLVADLAQADLRAPALDGAFTIDATEPVRGIATSGWQGRSFSLGIADAVTVLAATAAGADAAATAIANAVDASHPAIERRPANLLRDDSDLGDRLVTVAVGSLPHELVRDALARGAAVAHALQRLRLIDRAVLVCQGQARIVEPARAAAALTECPA